MNDTKSIDSRRETIGTGTVYIISGVRQRVLVSHRYDIFWIGVGVERHGNDIGRL